jgi:hypothetical protein
VFISIAHAPTNGKLSHNNWLTALVMGWLNVLNDALLNRVFCQYKEYRVPMNRESNIFSFICLNVGQANMPFPPLMTPSLRLNMLSGEFVLLFGRTLIYISSVAQIVSAN